MQLQALDLVAPIYRNMDSYLGVREKTLVLFASGILQKKQHNLQEARYFPTLSRMNFNFLFSCFYIIYTLNTEIMISTVVAGHD